MASEQEQKHKPLFGADSDDEEDFDLNKPNINFDALTGLGMAAPRDSIVVANSAESSSDDKTPTSDQAESETNSKNKNNNNESDANKAVEEPRSSGNVNTESNSSEKPMLKRKGLLDLFAAKTSEWSTYYNETFPSITAQEQQASQKMGGILAKLSTRRKQKQQEKLGLASASSSRETTTTTTTVTTESSSSSTSTITTSTTTTTTTTTTKIAKKRKHDTEAETSASEDRTYGKKKRAERNVPSNYPPWATRVYSSDPARALHEEIVDFYEFMKPTEAEIKMRNEVLKDLREIVTSLWADAKIEIYGSYESGICLPTSDIDVSVVLESAGNDPIPYLRELATRLKTRGKSRHLKLIEKARVPIIKYVHMKSGQEVDISFNTANGKTTTKVIKACVERFEHFKYLAMLLKCFLHQRGLNEVFTGGLGSYGISLMLLSHLQMHPLNSIPSDQYDTPLGIILVDFMKLYGCLFNYITTGISVANGGSYYNKQHRGKYQELRPWLLSVEDPTDASNDVTKGSYNIMIIRKAFAYAYNVLTSAKSHEEKVRPTILSRLFSVDHLFMKRREAIERVYGDNADSDAVVVEGESDDDDGGHDNDKYGDEEEGATENDDASSSSSVEVIVE